MATSWEKLVNNLGKGGNSKFKERIKIFRENDIDLVARKGLYPYEYETALGRVRNKIVNVIDALLKSHRRRTD